MSYFSIKSALNNFGKGGLPLNVTEDWGTGIKGIEPIQRSIHLQRKEYVDQNHILKDQHHFFDTSMDTEFIQKYERGVNPSVKVIVPSQQSGTQNQFNKVNQDVIINQNIAHTIDKGFGRQPRKTTSLMSLKNKSGLRPIINNDINGILSHPLQTKINQSIEGFKTISTQPQYISYFAHKKATKDRLKSCLINPNKKKIVKKIDFKIIRKMSDGLYKNVNTNKTFITKDGQHNKTSLQKRLINNKINTKVDPVIQYIPKRTLLNPDILVKNSTKKLLQIQPDFKKKFKTNHNFMKSIINITNKTNNKQHIQVNTQKQFLSKQSEHGKSSLFKNHFNNKIKISADSKKQEKPKWLIQGTLSRFKKNTRNQIQKIKAYSLQNKPFRKQIIPDNKKSFKKQIQPKINISTQSTKTFIPKTQDINDKTQFNQIRNKMTNSVSVSTSKNPLYNKKIKFHNIKPKINNKNINTTFTGQKLFNSKPIEINSSKAFKSVRTKDNLKINVNTNKKGLDKKVVYQNLSRLKSILKDKRAVEPINTNHKKLSKRVQFKNKKPKSVKQEPLYITQVNTNISKHPKKVNVSIQNKYYTKQNIPQFNVNTSITKPSKTGIIKTQLSEKTKTKMIPKHQFTGREQGRFKNPNNKQYNSLMNKIKNKKIKTHLYTIPETGQNPDIKHPIDI